jgi:hypothetical protein
LKKRTSINSIPQLHKEKEMADFRKCLLAFAAGALVLATAPAVSAQSTQPFSCTASAANPPLVRAEGVTEEVGDVVLVCTGGTPTAVGQPIPESNVSVTLNTTITDRILNQSTGLSEALLIVDDAFPAAPVPSTAIRSSSNSAATQLVCPATGGVNTCAITSTGTASGAPGGDYDGNNVGVTHYNVFQGVVTGANQITFLGVPIDAPGTVGTLTLRITNIRANASQLTVGSQFSLSPLQMFIAVNGAQTITINNPQPIVGYVTPGLITSAKSVTIEQCLPVSSAMDTFTVNFTENFASAFKTRQYPSALVSATTPATPAAAQNVPGFSYNSESGMFDPTNSGGSYAQGGQADHGTRLLIRFSGFPAGVSLSIPGTVALMNGSSTQTGLLYYVPTDGYGNSAAGFPTAPAATVTVALDSTGSGWATYEVVGDDPTAVESASIPVTAVPSAAGATSFIGASLGTGSVKLSFAPIPAPGTTGWTVSEPSTYPLPRFVDTSVSKNALTIVPCTCNLLFPFVTNQAGFDTGIAIANTSLDPYGTQPQSGPVTLNFYGQLAGGTALTASQAMVTTPSVPAGCILTMTLSGGGSITNCANAPSGSVAPLAGFQGYIIAQANFQYCHGFAFITDMGAHSLAEGYLGLVLDKPGNYRTQTGENLGQ